MFNYIHDAILSTWPFYTHVVPLFQKSSGRPHLPQQQCKGKPWGHHLDVTHLYEPMLFALKFGDAKLLVIHVGTGLNYTPVFFPFPVPPFSYSKNNCWAIHERPWQVKPQNGEDVCEPVLFKMVLTLMLNCTVAGILQLSLFSSYELM